MPIDPIVSRGWAKASACRLRVSLSCGVLCQIVSLQYLSRSSLRGAAFSPLANSPAAIYKNKPLVIYHVPLLIIPETYLLQTFFLCLQMILPSPCWSVFMSKMYKRTSSVQHICCSPTTIHEHGPEQAIENVHMHSVSSGTT